MPFGDTLNDYEFGWYPAGFGANELVFPDMGASLPAVDLISVEGLLDYQVRDEDRENASLFGDLASFHRPEPRYVRLELEIRGVVGNSTYYDTVMFYRRLFGPQVDETEGSVLAWKWPGEPQKFIRARPIRRREPKSADTEYGKTRMFVELKAADPRMYSQELHSQASGTYQNAGNVPAYPRVEIIPGGSDQVEILFDQPGVEFSGQFVDGSGNLFADFDELVRLTNNIYIYRGAVDNYANWNHPRQLGHFLPGGNTITVTTGTIDEILWRDTWI